MSVVESKVFCTRSAFVSFLLELASEGLRVSELATGVLLLGVVRESLDFGLDAQRASSANDRHVDVVAAYVAQLSKLGHKLCQLRMRSRRIDDLRDFVGSIVKGFLAGILKGFLFAHSRKASTETSRQSVFPGVGDSSGI